MLFVMKRNYFPSRVALCGLCLVALLFVLAGCGGSSGVAANAPASMSTNTTTAIVFRLSLLAHCPSLLVVRIGSKNSTWISARAG